MKTQKITAHLPLDLLKSAQDVTHKGITETIREGLAMLARSKGYDKFLNGYGKIKLDIDLNALRED